MREILFRAKSEKGTKWLYGTPVYYQNGGASIYNNRCPQHGYEATQVHVMRDKCQPETIGQYTGMNDKNGNKIFEGDICKYIAGNILEVWFEHGCFLIGRKGGYDTHLYGKQRDGITVIGNIHEHPELLNQG